MNWREQAACKGMDTNLFMPERGQDDRPAKRICEGCPVREPCLEVGMESRFVVGVWGGMSERQRRQLRYSRKSEAA